MESWVSFSKACTSSSPCSWRAALISAVALCLHLRGHVLSQARFLNGIPQGAMAGAGTALWLSSAQKQPEPWSQLINSGVFPRQVLSSICLSVANSYSRGDREFEKATEMLFPSKVAQRGRMRDHTAAPFPRRVTV